MAEPILFGTATQNSRHFTTFSLKHDPDETETELSEDLKAVINLMNPMYFIAENNPGCAPNWWIRHGACDKDTSLSPLSPTWPPPFMTLARTSAPVSSGTADTAPMMIRRAS